MLACRRLSKNSAPAAYAASVTAHGLLSRLTTTVINRTLKVAVHSPCCAPGSVQAQSRLW